MTSLSLSIRLKQQNMIQVNGYVQVVDVLEHLTLDPIQIDQMIIQKNYTDLKKMLTPDPSMIKSIPFCLYNLPIWHSYKDHEFYYTKLIINRWICTIVVKPCVFDFVRFEKHGQFLYTDYDMYIVTNNSLDIVKYGYINEKNPIEISAVP